LASATIPCQQVMLFCVLEPSCFKTGNRTSRPHLRRNPECRDEVSELRAICPIMFRSPILNREGLRRSRRGPTGRFELIKRWRRGGRNVFGRQNGGVAAVWSFAATSDVGGQQPQCSAISIFASVRIRCPCTEYLDSVGDIIQVWFRSCQIPDVLNRGLLRTA